MKNIISWRLNYTENFIQFTDLSQFGLCILLLLLIYKVLHSQTPDQNWKTLCLGSNKLSGVVTAQYSFQISFFNFSFIYFQNKNKPGRPQSKKQIITAVYNESTINRELCLFSYSVQSQMLFLTKYLQIIDNKAIKHGRHMMITHTILQWSFNIWAIQCKSIT